MGQTEDFGLRPPDPAGETANRVAQHAAGEPADAPGWRFSEAAAEGAGRGSADAPGGRPSGVAAEGAARGAVAEVTTADAAGAPAAGGVPVEVTGGAEPGVAGERAGQAGGQRPAVGDSRVDAVLARLDELDGLPVTEHRAVFEDVHRRLRDVLGELDTGEPRGGGDAAGRPGR